MLKALINNHITIIIGSFTPAKFFTCHLFPDIIFDFRCWCLETGNQFTLLGEVGLWTFPLPIFQGLYVRPQSAAKAKKKRHPKNPKTGSNQWLL